MAWYRFPGILGPIAGGNIAPRTFIKLDTTTVGQVLACGAGDQIIGVAQQGQRDTPGLTGSDTAIAAKANDELDAFGEGDVAEVDCGGTVAIGDWVKSDASGKAVTHTLAGGAEFVGGRALNAGTSGTTIKVLLSPSQVN